MLYSQLQEPTHLRIFRISQNSEQEFYPILTFLCATKSRRRNAKPLLCFQFDIIAKSKGMLSLHLQSEIGQVQFWLVLSWAGRAGWQKEPGNSQAKPNALVDSHPSALQNPWRKVFSEISYCVSCVWFEQHERVILLLPGSLLQSQQLSFHTLCPSFPPEQQSFHSSRLQEPSMLPCWQCSFP